MTRSEPRRRKNRFSLYYGVLLLLLSVPVIAASSAAESAQTPSGLERQIREWTAALSVKEPFAEWKGAVPDIQALGPGTHGWLAILKTGGKPVGYLVVYAAHNGTYRLGEYGTGPDVLFSSATLNRTLMENGLIGPENEAYTAVRHYFHPFAALWEVKIGSDTYWADAKTGEILPFDPASWKRLLPSLKSTGDKALQAAAANQRIVSLFVKETFNPYGSLPWLTGKRPLTLHNDAKAQRRIRDLHLRYVTEPFGDAALYALPVTGFLSWQAGRLDLALDMEGNRFIPIDVLNRYGRFYE